MHHVRVRFYPIIIAQKNLVFAVRMQLCYFPNFAYGIKRNRDERTRYPCHRRGRVHRFPFG